MYVQLFIIIIFVLVQLISLFSQSMAPEVRMAHRPHACNPFITESFAMDGPPLMLEWPLCTILSTTVYMRHPTSRIKCEPQLTQIYMVYGAYYFSPRTGKVRVQCVVVPLYFMYQFLIPEVLRPAYSRSVLVRTFPILSVSGAFIDRLAPDRVRVPVVLVSLVLASTIHILFSSTYYMYQWNTN